MPSTVRTMSLLDFKIDATRTACCAAYGDKRRLLKLQPEDALTWALGLCKCACLLRLLITPLLYRCLSSTKSCADQLMPTQIQTSLCLARSCAPRATLMFL